MNPDEPRTGESADSEGYVYRTLYPRTQDLARIAGDATGRAGTPYFKDAVLDDPLLAELLRRCHECMVEQCASVECEERVLRAMARLVTMHADPRVSPRPVGILNRSYLPGRLRLPEQQPNRH